MNNQGRARERRSRPGVMEVDRVRSAPKPRMRFASARQCRLNLLGVENTILDIIPDDEEHRSLRTRFSTAIKKANRIPKDVLGFLPRNKHWHVLREYLSVYGVAPMMRPRRPTRTAIS